MPKRRRSTTYHHVADEAAKVNYFENLGGNGKASGEFAKALDKQFGSAARWEELVRTTAMSLGVAPLSIDPSPKYHSYWTTLPSASAAYAFADAYTRTGAAAVDVVPSPSSHANVIG